MIFPCFWCIELLSRRRTYVVITIPDSDFIVCRTVLADAEFDTSRGHITFPVAASHAGEPLSTRKARLEILSNHGHTSYTCLYRFRVHGSPLL